MTLIEIMTGWLVRKTEFSTSSKDMMPQSSAWKALLQTRIVDVSLFLAILTAVSYAVTLIYQQAYYKAFNIDSNAFDLSLAPELVLNSVVILAGIVATGLIMYFYSRILTVATKFVEKYMVVFVEVFAVLVLIVSLVGLFAPSVIQELISGDILPNIPYVIYRIIFSIFSVLMAAYFTLKLTITIRSDANKNFFQRYKDVGIEAIDRSTMKNRFGWFMPYWNVPHWILPVIIIIILTPVLPTTIAQNQAKDKTDFIELVKVGHDSRADTKSLVIGKNGYGLILKEYNLETKAFNEGFSVLEFGNYQFKPVSIQR